MLQNQRQLSTYNQTTFQGQGHNPDRLLDGLYIVVERGFRELFVIDSSKGVPAGTIPLDIEGSVMTYAVASNTDSVNVCISYYNGQLKYVECRKQENSWSYVDSIKKTNGLFSSRSGFIAQMILSADETTLILRTLTGVVVAITAVRDGISNYHRIDKSHKMRVAYMEFIGPKSFATMNKDGLIQCYRFATGPFRIVSEQTIRFPAAKKDRRMLCRSDDGRIRVILGARDASGRYLLKICTSVQKVDGVTTDKIEWRTTVLSDEDGPIFCDDVLHIESNSSVIVVHCRNRFVVINAKSKKVVQNITKGGIKVYTVEYDSNNYWIVYPGGELSRYSSDGDCETGLHVTLPDMSVPLSMEGNVIVYIDSVGRIIEYKENGIKKELYSGRVSNYPKFVKGRKLIVGCKEGAFGVVVLSRD